MNKKENRLQVHVNPATMEQFEKDEMVVITGGAGSEGINISLLLCFETNPGNCVEQCACEESEEAE